MSLLNNRKTKMLEGLYLGNGNTILVFRLTFQHLSSFDTSAKHRASKCDKVLNLCARSLKLLKSFEKC